MAKRKISINATEVIELVRNGTSNRDLAKRYGLSPRGVRRLYEKLVAAGQLSPTEAPFQERPSR
jgi:transposase